MAAAGWGTKQAAKTGGGLFQKHDTPCIVIGNRLFETGYRLLGPSDRRQTAGGLFRVPSGFCQIFGSLIGILLAPNAKQIYKSATGLSTHGEIPTSDNKNCFKGSSTVHSVYDRMKISSYDNSFLSHLRCN